MVCEVREGGELVGLECWILLMSVDGWMAGKRVFPSEADLWNRYGYTKPATGYGR